MQTNDKKEDIKDSTGIYLPKKEDVPKETGKLTREDEHTFRRVKEESFFNIRKNNLVTS